MKTSSTIVIAEAGVNHNGSLQRAKELVDAAADAGADAVKFQTFRAEALVSRQAPKAEYQSQATDPDESQLQMIQQLELDNSAFLELANQCRDRGVEFLSTPFDSESLDFLVREVGVARVKISSGDLNNGPLLLQVARLGSPVILSTGMATLGNVEEALAILAFGYLEKTEETPEQHKLYSAYASPEGRELLRKNVSVLHCTTAYPTPLESVNLRAMNTLADAFGLTTGYSDHTQGITVAIAAVARGARIIEKHFTLDKNLEGPDHKASLEPQELAQMISMIRETQTALGSSVKHLSSDETKNLAAARKSLVAARAVKRGELWNPENLTVKRPGDGVTPMRYWDYLGQAAGRDYEADEVVDQ